MPRTGTVGTPIYLKVNFYVNGILFDPYSIDPVSIYDRETSGTRITQISPVRSSKGKYLIVWNVPLSTEPGSYYDQWTWTAEDGMASKTQRYSFDLQSAGIYAELPEEISVNCYREGPSWIQHVGVRVAKDLGNGMAIQLMWGRATPANIRDDVYYNIYYSRTRFGVFSEKPKAVTADDTAIIHVDPGKIYYCAVRATEFNSRFLDITGLTQIGENTYAYPDEQELLEPIDGYGCSIKVATTEGYLLSGYIYVGSEIVRYNSKTSTTFVVAEEGRGAFNTEISDHSVGAKISIWNGVEDSNTNILSGTADWFYTYGQPQNINAIGQVNVDEDGYRAANEDILTTNLSASDENTENFPTYDYAGYHRPSIQDTLSGECVHSYVGGEFNGGRGFFYQERIMSQLDALLQTTGEPVVLLKRKWTGRRCKCISLRREHQRDRCDLCYGSGFEGGYDRFVNTRPISEKFVNMQGMINIRVVPFTDDLELVQDQGLRQPAELTAWTLTYPTLKDRDVIVRFTEDGIIEYMYEVLNVTRNKLFFSQSGRQEFRLRRLDKTDEIYKFKTTII